jgi:short-subunit dehydrogenase
MTELKGAVVLLTGAGGGFGRELTRQLLELGSHLVLTDLDVSTLAAAPPEAADPPGARWREADQPHSPSGHRDGSPATGRILAAIAADLSQSGACDALYDRIAAKGIAIDVLINNAGLGLYGRLCDLPTTEWERLMQVNLMAPTRLCARFSRDAIRRGSGHIVNICSLASCVAPAGLSVYAAAKFGLRGLSESLAHELRPHGVRVSAVHPFFSRTPILRSLRCGDLAASDRLSSLEGWLTDPAAVMRTTLEGIRRNRLHIYPDPMARIIHWLSRFMPFVVNGALRIG